MQFILNELSTAFVQIVLFSAIPFIVWFATNKRGNETSFLKWIGIAKPIVDKKRLLPVSLLIILIMVFVSLVLDPLIDDIETTASLFKGLGMQGFLPLLIFSFIKTGLSEELFFRGFLGKRLISKFGFLYGNIIQSMVFGLIHGLIFASNNNMLLAVAITLATGLVGWLMGYMTEKLSNGSIVTGWITHGICNFVTTLPIMFNIIL